MSNKKLKIIQKQDIEYPMFHLCNGGNIQYCRYPVQYNKEAIKIPEDGFVVSALGNSANVMMESFKKGDKIKLDIDFEELKSTDRLFARKFDIHKDKRVVEKILESL